MEIITFAGPPASGKTSVIIHTIKAFEKMGKRVGVIKLDCLATNDDEMFAKNGIEVAVGISANLCPDHFFVCNIEDCFKWGIMKKFNILIVESAGLCNRCSPHIEGIKAVCVIDNLMGVNTPKKIGPMLKMADIVVITKGDIVSQAEREVFAFKVRQANSRGIIMNINGITGQGCCELAQFLKDNKNIETVCQEKLRFTMPSALCSYCLGETKIGMDFQMGNVRRMKLE